MERKRFSVERTVRIAGSKRRVMNSPMVWRPSEVEFLGTERIGRALWQNVLMRGADGVLYEVEYEMIPGEDGWKINGVRVKKADEGLA